MALIPVRDCRELVERRQPFKTYGSLYAEHTSASDGSDLYVVYSYGPHWPLYVYHNPTGLWFGNADKTSMTTSRHASAARPRYARIHWLCWDDMTELAYNGLLGVMFSQSA